jgi:hypothetical protein
MKKAILVENAVCVGSGKDWWKRINGLTKAVIEKCNSIDDTASILVPSHTNYNGQKYKLALFSGSYGYTHRQINDRDYDIIATI